VHLPITVIRHASTVIRHASMNGKRSPKDGEAKPFRTLLPAFLLLCAPSLHTQSNNSNSNKTAFAGEGTTAVITLAMGPIVRLDRRR
jgi:hypothetical protein